MKTFLMIYFIIGAVIAVISTVANIILIKQMRKDVRRRRLFLESLEKDGKSYETLNNYKRTCVVRPWYIDYFIALLAMIFNLLLWPGLVKDLIVKKTVFKRIKYCGEDDFFEFIDK